MKFDVVVGNPPYQELNVGENNQAVPMYHRFYELAEKCSDKYILITPARFLANQGATPKAWNKKMLSDKHISIKYFNSKSDEVFPNTEIKGGVVVLLRDKNKDFGEIDTFIEFEPLRNIYNKIRQKSSSYLSEIVFSPDSYRFNNNLFSENPNLIGRTDESHAKAVSSSVFKRYPEIFSKEKPVSQDEHIRIYGRLDGERVYFWVKRNYLSEHLNLDKWKVFIAGANGSGAFGETLSLPVVGEPSVGHNQTFVSIGKFDSEFEANSLLKYIKTKFARALLGIMKTTQNNQSKNTWSKIPLQDFSKKSDIDWSLSISDIDLQLYKKYELNTDEVCFIEKTVKTME